MFLLKEARRFYESESAAVDSFENECRGAIWKYWKKTFSSRAFYEEERFSFGRNRSHALFWGEDWQMDRRYRVSLGFQKRDLCPLERSIPWRKTLFFFFSFYKDRNHFLVPRDPPFSPLYIYLASENRVISPVPRSRTVNFSKWKYSLSRCTSRES